MQQGAILDQCFLDTRRIDIAAAGDALTVPIAFLDELTKCRTRLDVLEVYSVWAGRMTNADRCSITLRNDDDWLMVTAIDGSDTRPKTTHHPVKNSTVRAVFRRCETLFLEDVRLIDLPDAKVVADLGYRSAVLTPIHSGTTRFGTLAASYKKPVTNPAPQIAMIEALAGCLATQLLIIEQMEELRIIARTDALTGAGNRHDLYEQADAVWAKWAADGQLFSFMCMDVDHFKQINDTYGHDVGDSVLAAFVQRILSRSRGTDRMIRTGGEEFGMLMFDTALIQATERAQRLCDAVGDSPFAVSGMEVVITASFGVTQVMPGDQSFQDVMIRADMALYEAKAAGRDQVVSIDDAELAA